MKPVRRRRPATAAVASAVTVTAVAAVLGACSSDGRELRAPTFPLPATTTTLPAAVPTVPTGP